MCHRKSIVIVVVVMVAFLAVFLLALWGPAGVGHPHTVSADCGQLVARPTAPPAGAEPGRPHSVELRLPRRIVPQGSERRIESVAV